MPNKYIIISKINMVEENKYQEIRLKKIKFWIKVCAINARIKKYNSIMKKKSIW